MIGIPKAVISFGALALAAGVLTLGVPRAAHAVAAALVQVSNPPASPANTEDTSRQANQLVQLLCPFPSNGGTSICTTGGLNGPAYTVPNNQSLVITSAELFSQDFSNIPNSLVSLINSSFATVYHYWVVSGSNGFQYNYPSGIVLPPGTQPLIFSAGGPVVVQLNGYLTTN